MFIDRFKNNGSDYLRICKSVRIPGKKGSTKIPVANIGPLSKFDDGKPNYLDRLRESYKNGTPLIEELIPYIEDKTSKKKSVTITFTEGDLNCFGNPKLYSHELLDTILKELGINSFITTIKHKEDISFDILGFVRLLVFGRILDPASKIATTNQNDNYYDPIVKNMYSYNVYDTLDYINDYKYRIYETVNNSITKNFKRSTDLVFYDVTNMYFETERPDDDVEDEDGNITKGLRKFGVSKENRRQPIVQMGLFMDNNGLPIAIETFPGNTLDHLTVRDSLDNTINKMNFKRFIFVGDRGMCNAKNNLHLVNSGNGYIVSKSINKESKKDKEWDISDIDGKEFTVCSENFKYKSRVVHKVSKNADNELQEYDEKEVVYWSKSFYDRAVAENESLLKVLEKIKEHPENFRLTKAMSKSLSKFTKSKVLLSKTGEVVNSRDIEALLDYDKINAFTSYFGYYKIVTSEINMPDQEIIDKYHSLSQIEDQFRIMKSSLEIRPVHVRTAEHIDAHLVICFLALLVTRIIQNRIKSSPNFNRNNKVSWESGLSADRIISALNKWQIDSLDKINYRFNNIEDKDLKTILDAFEVEIPAKIYSRGDLTKVKSSIKIK